MSLLSVISLGRLRCLSVLILILPLFACSGGGGGGGSSLNLPSWKAPTEREDGTALSPAEIGGYRVYYGTVQGIYPNQLTVLGEKVVKGDIDNISSGKYFAVVTTVDFEGRESNFSEMVSVTF
ncbi:hypothetical protein MNBD_GAMMA05-1238 [hydrothermal vent metagenome]|uniref:Uncharacterized protein n=1 Tax=hydrothermal vent metagenome TaxID=652676 RepID=A0A3B0WD07_9ZZZZ